MAEAHTVAGKHAIYEALSAGVPLTQAFVQDGFQDEKLLSKLKRAGVPVEQVGKAQLARLTNNAVHQGIVCKVRPYEYASISDILAAPKDKTNALVLLLDHITDEGNLGAILRSAEVLGASGVVIPKDRSASIGAGAYKTSAGATFVLPVACVTNLAHACEELKQAGFWATAATEHADESLSDVELWGRTCIILGSEQTGVSQGMLKHADMCAKIVQTGKLESLNVAQAATICAYEWARQCQERNQA